jgi:two-component system chemotaxis response regulator CheY
MQVLVVDDSGTMRKIIVRALNSLGVNQIMEAGNGLEAWECFQNGSFDLVMTDWNMPEMNGIDLLRKIRGINKQVPVIMITTEGEKCRVVEAIQAGVSDYLCKPFEFEALRAKIEKFAMV